MRSARSSIPSPTEPVPSTGTPSRASWPTTTIARSSVSCAFWRASPMSTARREKPRRETVAAKVIGRIEPIPTIPLSQPARRADSGPGADSGIAPSGQTPEQWGSLQLVEKVGEGTFGEVYRAFDSQLHREVALKLLKPEKSPGRLAAAHPARGPHPRPRPPSKRRRGAWGRDRATGVSACGWSTSEARPSTSWCASRARSARGKPRSSARICVARWRRCMAPASCTVTSRRRT